MKFTHIISILMDLSWSVKSSCSYFPRHKQGYSLSYFISESPEEGAADLNFDLRLNATMLSISI